MTIRNLYAALRPARRLVAALGAACLAAACQQEIDLDHYRSQEGADLLTLNAIANPDSVVTACATRPFFFTDYHTERDYVTGLSLELWVNGAYRGPMPYDPATRLYRSDCRPAEGDIVTLRTRYAGRDVEATDTVPRRVRIESISVERHGPLQTYTSNDWQYTYRITFTDAPGEANYYFLQYDALTPLATAFMGERDFTAEFVFQQLARQVNADAPGWEPYSPDGLPFSDRGIEGQRHTLVVKELLSLGWLRPSADDLKRKVRLYAISRAYYDYLVSIIASRSGDAGLRGGLIDLGMAEPAPAFTNVRGGTGLLGGYVLSEQLVDLVAETGPLPR